MDAPFRVQMKPQYANAAALTAWQQAWAARHGGNAPDMGRLQFQQIPNGPYIGWDEYNGVAGFQPDGDYARFVNGYGRKKLSDRKLADFQNRVAALTQAGFPLHQAVDYARAPGKATINSIVSGLLTGVYNALGPAQRQQYPKIAAIHDFYAWIKANLMDPFIQANNIPDPGDPVQRQKLVKKLLKTQEWVDYIQQNAPQGQALAGLLANGFQPPAAPGA
jgi:hypothetical protein